jgi:hypothetical protein
MPARILHLVATLAAMVVATRHGSAQSVGFAVDRFEPSERGSDWFVSDSLDLRGFPNIAAGVVSDWSYRPLVLRESDASGAPRRNIIVDRIALHPGLSLMLHDRLRGGVELPVVVYQTGDVTSPSARGLGPLGGAGAGDLRLAADVRVLGQYGDVFTTAVGLQAHLPTGKQSQLTSDGTLRLTPRVLVAGDGEGLLYAAQLGCAYRPLDGRIAGRELGSELTFSVAGGVRVNDMFVFGPELFGSTVFGNGARLFERRGTPLELLLGLHVRLAKNWQIGSAIGPGLTQGDGSPSMRLVLSLELAPDVCVDPDGDGICNPLDACPDVDGVRTGERRTNGCPGDRDHDGVLDNVDACVDRGGPPSGNAAKNGCPPDADDSTPAPVEPK